MEYLNAHQEETKDLEAGAGFKNEHDPKCSLALWKVPTGLPVIASRLYSQVLDISSSLR
ncbi:hypothetical protein LTR40_008961, partial [Exophiala xenobiotica]